MRSFDIIVGIFTIVSSVIAFLIYLDIDAGTFQPFIIKLYSIITYPIPAFVLIIIAVIIYVISRLKISLSSSKDVNKNDSVQEIYDSLVFEDTEIEVRFKYFYDSSTNKVNFYTYASGFDLYCKKHDLKMSKLDFGFYSNYLVCPECKEHKEFNLSNEQVWALIERYLRDKYKTQN